MQIITSELRDGGMETDKWWCYDPRHHIGIGIDGSPAFPFG
jgi:hypothetical protein